LKYKCIFNYSRNRACFGKGPVVYFLHRLLYPGVDKIPNAREERKSVSPGNGVLYHGIFLASKIVGPFGIFDLFSIGYKL
jgi:hypothetical protein